MRTQLQDAPQLRDGDLLVMRLCLSAPHAGPKMCLSPAAVILFKKRSYHMVKNENSAVLLLVECNYSIALSF